MSDLVVFPGTFDPITFGHLDVIGRGVELFGRVLVAVADWKGTQKDPLFEAAERTEMIRLVVAHIAGVEVTSYTGMTAAFVKSVGARCMIRGLRAQGDFEYEYELALANKGMEGVETVFLIACREHAFLRSTLIREAAALGADVSGFVPQVVAARLREKFPPPME